MQENKTASGSRRGQFLHSIRGRILLLLILVLFLTNAIAVGFGYYLYASSESREVRVRTMNNSRAAAEVLDLEETRREAAITAEVYGKAEEADRKARSEEYLARFAEVRGEAFEAQRKRLDRMREATDSTGIFTVLLDVENNRLVYITDSDLESSFCPPGSWDRVNPADAEAYLHNAKPELLDRFYGVHPQYSPITVPLLIISSAPVQYTVAP